MLEHLQLLIQSGAASSGFSGAEIEQAIISTMYSALSEREELNADHLRAELRGTRPLSVLMAEQVADLRAWARNGCVSAN